MSKSQKGPRRPAIKLPQIQKKMRKQAVGNVRGKKS